MMTRYPLGWGSPEGVRTPQRIPSVRHRDAVDSISEWPLIGWVDPLHDPFTTSECVGAITRQETVLRP